MLQSFNILPYVFLSVVNWYSNISWYYLLKFYYPHNSNDLNIKFRPAIELNLNEYLYPFISHFIFLSAYGQEHFLEKLLFEFSIFLIVTFQISLNSPRVKLNGNAVCKVCQFTQHKPLSARLRFSSSFILTIFVKMAGSIIRFRMNSLVYSFNIAWIKLGYCNGKYIWRSIDSYD